MTGPELCVWCRHTQSMYLCKAVATEVMGWRIGIGRNGGRYFVNSRGEYGYKEDDYRPDLNSDQYKEVEKKVLGESYCIDVCVYHDQINVIIYPTIHIIEPPVMAMEFPRDRFTELHARLETLLDAWRKMKGQDDD